MIGNLEYLMASLPYLSFRNNEEEHSSVQTLLRRYGGPQFEEAGLIDILDSEASKFLDSRSYDLFQGLELDIIHQQRFRESWSPLVSDFANYMYALKLQIAALRRDRKASRERVSPAKYNLPFRTGTPLEEEVQLLSLQWEAVEDLRGNHTGELAWLIAYKIQLMLLLRWWSFDSEEGITVFNELTKSA